MMLEDILIRVTISLLFGGILGLERALKNKPAGLITITLVCTGASMISMLQISILEKQILMIKENPELINLMSADMGRLGAQVISGIGFIGGGAIIYSKGSVQGITTAAVLWISACLGLTIGYGFLKLSIVSFIGFLTIIYIMRWAEKYCMKNNLLKKITVRIYDEEFEKQ